MATYSLKEKIEYKKFIFSIIDNKYKYLHITNKDIKNIRINTKTMKSAIKLNKTISEIYINKNIIDKTNTYYNDYIDNLYDDDNIVSKILVWFLGYSKSIRIISINNINIKEASLKQIFEVLTFNTTLEKLEINCKINLLDTNFLLKFLENNTTLKVLSLQNIIFEDIYDLAQGLSKNKTLIYLNLSNSSIKNIDFLSTTLTINDTLTHLNLENIIIERSSLFKTLIKALEKNKGIVKINLSNNRLIDFDIYDLSETIKNNTTLKNIDLSHNNINTINSLLKSLQYNTTLKVINLQYNNIKIYNQYSKLKINNTVIFK